MASRNDSVVGVVVVPLIGGLVGLFLLGPFGFFVGVTLPLVVGEYWPRGDEAKDERIAELEQRVEELENDRTT